MPASSLHKRIVTAINGDPPTVSNRLNVGLYKVRGVDAVEELLNVGVTGADGRRGLRPRLAEAVPSLENGEWRLLADGRMETTWRIRPGAAWHDAVPFTADDLVFTAAVLQDSEFPFFRDPVFDSVERVEAREPQTLAVTWKRPYIYADGLFAVSPLPRHLLQGPFIDSKAAFTELPYWHQEFVGTGPFRLAEFVRGSHLVMTANDRYVVGRPKVEQIEVRFIPDSNTLMANVLAGTVEATLGRALSVDQALQVRDQWRDGTLATSVAFSTWVVIFPQFISAQPPVVTDLRLRRALYHAIDRQSMADIIQGGLSSVAHSIVSPGEPEYREVESYLTKYEYDPRRAVQLIEEIGYSRGSDAFFRDVAGQRLAVEIRTLSADLNQKSMFPVVDYWERVGVDVEPVVIPPQRATDQEYRATFPAFILERNPGGELAALSRYHGSQARTLENRYQGGNYARYINPEFDAHLDRVFATIPRAERAQVAGQIVRHMSEQLPALGLFYDADPTLISNRLRAVEGKDGTEAWNAEAWDVTPR